MQSVVIWIIRTVIAAIGTTAMKSLFAFIIDRTIKAIGRQIREGLEARRKRKAAAEAKRIEDLRISAESKKASTLAEKRADEAALSKKKALEEGTNHRGG